MKKALSLILALAMVLALAACGPDNASQPSGNSQPPASEPPASQPPASQPPASEPPASQPPASEPPASQPPASEPPASEPPASEPPASEPPASEPPASEPPASEPPASEPPASEPPASQPPASEPPVSQPPASEPPASQPPASEPPASQPPASEPPASQPPATVTPASTTINFGSQTTALEGTWKLAQVKTASGAYAAQANAISLKVSLEEDPYEMVDGEAYIHNRVWNLTAFLSFGLADVKAELDADDIDSYKGSATWEAFTKGKVMADGEWYEQPGPAVVRFKDIDDFGLYLDKVAGVPDDIETTERNLIIAMNSSGQLLLGYSKSHIENEGTAGDWVYCLVFEK